MIIGVPGEIKDSEYRVGLGPSGAPRLTGDGHQVLIVSGAGTGSGFGDEEYQKANTTIVANTGEVYSLSDMVVKVATLARLTEVLVQRRVTGIAYETLCDRDGGFG